jgi:diguanylate cyclase (GGDEF)-like protein
MVAITALLLLKQHRLRLELRRTNKSLEEAALTDPLTGIRNRRYFQATVGHDVAQSLRAYSARSDTCTRDLVFYLLDMDNFKAVNDVFGHDAGDRVLIEVTRRISSAIRDSDVLLRWGGEEFLIVSRATDRRIAPTLAERVLQAVRETPVAIDEILRIPCTCSAGWAAFPWFQDNPAALGYDKVINLADQALRKAKNAGKNCAFGITPSEVETTPFEEAPKGARA